MKPKCPKNQLESDEMKDIPYASTVGSLMYAQVCTRPDLAFATGMFGRYQKNPGKVHWVGVKKALRYCQGTKDFMLTYRRSDNLEVWVILMLTLLDVWIVGNLHQDISTR